MAELEVKVPHAEFVPVEALKIDNENPNQLSPRRFEALKKSIQRFGFVVPIITNRDLLVADGEHRLRAAKALGMKQVSIVRLPVDEVDRRLIRQVMNKLRGEHDLFMDAEEYYRIVSGDKRDLLKALLNETDVRIDNLLKLREPAVYSDEDLKAFGSVPHLCLWRGVHFLLEVDADGCDKWHRWYKRYVCPSVFQACRDFLSRK